MTTNSNFPTILQTDKSSAAQTTKGNIHLPSVSYDSTLIGSLGVTSGKWYYEARVQNNYGTYYAFGWVCANIDDSYKTEVGSSLDGALNWSQLGSVVIDGSYVVDPGSPSFYNTNTKIVGCALDLDNNKVYWHGNNTYINDTSGNAGNPSAGTYGFSIPTALQGQIFYPMIGTNAVGAPGTTDLNFGQDSTFQGQETRQSNADSNGFGDFYYAPPTSYLSLCDANMPTSSNIDPSETDSDYPGKQFNTVIYSGTGSSNALTGVNFQPDFVWIKRRNSATSHQLYDSSRGATKVIYSDANSAEATESTGLTAFGSDGFTLGTAGGANASGGTYVAWCWRVNGGTTASNSNGSITSTVQVNQNAGFSIVQTSGNGGNATIGHGLGAVPKLIFSKQLTGGNFSWVSYHPNQGADLSGGELGYLHLDSSQQFSDYNLIWNDTAPTSTVFSVGSAGNVNGNGSTYVHYCWAQIDGMSHFGGFKGNGSTDGPYIATGFKPKMIFIKKTSGTGNWECRDTVRDTYNPMDTSIVWDSNTTEASSAASSAYPLDVYSNGFKIRTTSANYNSDGANYIYGAWADVPAKFSNAR